jgi:hypothetical protein
VPNVGDGSPVLRRGPLVVRTSKRKKIRFPAWISYGGDPTPIPCMLWDVSEGGARITAAHSNLLPDTFTLALSQNGKTHHLCRVVWRKMPHIGIQFVESSEAAVAPRAPADSGRSGFGVAVPES